VVVVVGVVVVVVLPTSTSSNVDVITLSPPPSLHPSITTYLPVMPPVNPVWQEGSWNRIGDIMV